MTTVLKNVNAEHLRQYFLFAFGSISKSATTSAMAGVALLIMTVLSAVYANLFLYRVTPERITNFTIDKTLEMSFLNDDAL